MEMGKGGTKRTCRLITRGRMRAEERTCRINTDVRKIGEEDLQISYRGEEGEKRKEEMRCRLITGAG